MYNWLSVRESLKFNFNPNLSLKSDIYSVVMKAKNED